MASLTETVLQYSNGAVEVLGLHIKQKNILLFVLYRQPDDQQSKNRSTSREFKEALDALQNSMSERQTPYPDIVLCGDFNLPHINWLNGTKRPGATKDEQAMIDLLEDLTTEHFLFQQITRPTHKLGNTLDLLFSNNPAFLHEYQCSETILSDHYIIEGSAALKSSNEDSETYRRPNEDDGTSATFDKLNFFSEDVKWESIEEDLAKVDWSDVFSSLDPTQMLTKMLEVCADISTKHVPHRKTTPQSKKRNQIPRTRRILMRRRCKVNKQLCTANSESRREKLIAEARSIEVKLQNSHRAEKNEMEHRAVSAIKRNSKYFFSYAKKFSSISTGIGPLMDLAKNVISCPMKMAEMLANQYSSVFSTPKEPLEERTYLFPGEDHDVQAAHGSIMDIEFTREDLEEAINEIRPSAAAGPDRFPAILLKMCRKTLSLPLHIIWRRSLDTGVVPHLLKTANIIPIHKGNSRSLAKNYRPIALTSHLIKVFEKVIRKNIVKFMEDHNLFNPRQHGFRIGRSCLSQLLNHYDHILHLLEMGHNVDVIYLDFAKAFDKVDFTVTLKKIKQLGIQGNVGSWIYSFITSRTQTVLVNGARSEPSAVKSGVPQGSVLGPLLFLILIGDIDQSLTTAFLSSFADDTRVGHQVDSEEDAHMLQQDLNAVYQWTERNNMELNGDKFEHVHYPCPRKDEYLPQYTSNTGGNISTNDYVKDLGITMSSDGTFKQHIQRTVSEARRQAGWILRTFATREILPMLTLWKSLVQCKLDYCSQLWSPMEKGSIQSLEMVQRTFLRKIKSISNLTYWEQLKKLRMFSQERRRERYSIIYVWRILEEQVPNIYHSGNVTGSIVAKFHCRRGRICSVPPLNTQSPKAVQNLREASLPVRGQRLFNTLPQEVRNLTGCTVETFKRSLDKYLRDVPDEPQIPGYTSMRRAETNSIIYMARFRQSHQDSGVEGPGDQISSGNEGCASSVAMA